MRSRSPSRFARRDFLAASAALCLATTDVGSLVAQEAAAGDATATRSPGVGTVKPPGVPISYSPAKSRQFLGSPALAILSDGTHVVSHDFFGPGSTRDKSVVYASRDRGATWSKLAELPGRWWSSLFVHRDALHLLGTSREYGRVVLSRSNDGGRAWTESVLRDDAKYHTAPTPVIVHAGRVWKGFEDAEGPGGWGTHFRALALSAPVDADLSNPASWTHTNRIEPNLEWLDGGFRGFLEGNVVVTPDGKLVDVLRVERRHPDEKAAVVEISPDGATARFDPTAGFIDFPGGAKKFTIRWDERSKRYWSLANWTPPKFRTNHPAKNRNTLALVSSPDVREWRVDCVLLHHPDVEKHGFQYVDWLFDGDDLAAVVRTAFDDAETGARNQHDSNFVTFHRFEKFRTLTLRDSVVDPVSLGVTADAVARGFAAPNP